MTIQPIFVFSVSRSGSTLLQRVIASHDGVATVAEPWLLLPYAYTLREHGVRAEYFHPLMVTAIADFCAELPAGFDEYQRETREYALRLYERAASNGARYFLDKSPPYYLVAEEIMRLFPDGRFIFLWRNPLSVMASILETFYSGQWCPDVFRSDMFIGLPRLISAYRSAPAQTYAVRFEELLSGDDEVWALLMAYLGIQFDPDSLLRFNEVKLRGRMGDPTGVKLYSSLSTEPQDKWKAIMCNPLRKEFSRRYLAYLGAERLATMGYDDQLLLRELDEQPTSYRSLAADARRLAVDLLKEPVRVRIRRHSIGGPNIIRELLAAEP